MRMRKKPWANDMIESRKDCVISEPANYQGKWKTLYDGKLVVEIGSGKGDYWNQMAHKNPDELWLAVEKNKDAAAIALKKTVDDTTANMKMIISDAAAITEWFATQEIDRIHLNFSDPWPKKSHHKRRLTAESFLQSYKTVLKDDGSIVMKTDNKDLFEFSLVNFTNNGFLIDQVSVDFRRNQHDEDAITEYENNFMQLGQPIYRAVFKKNLKEQNG
ncbi:MAG: tRNA (guanosine(46)-N7)-methyltransferase TrmB [Erysipelotrichaceae bacterium]